MKSIRDVQNLEGVRVLVRLDLNVPIQNGVIVDDYRIRKSLPLINFLQEKKAKIIIISHIENDNPTLKPVAEYMNKLGIACYFEKKYKNVLTSDEQIILLENLRTYEGEKANDKKFAKELASLGDIYVNEAFSVSHREHASVCAITEFIPSYAGLQFEEEVKHLSSAFNPEHPFLFILGGAKFETKLPLLKKFVEIADKIFIGGALANDFFKAQGKDVKKSLVSSDISQVKGLLNNEKILLPVDDVWNNDAILDAGIKTIEMLKGEVEKAKYILWNGPLGAYEQGFKEATLELAKIISSSNAKTIVGGGDTLATITELKLESKFTFVSTGGGAMLDFLAKGTLPGIEALNKGM